MVPGEVVSSSSVVQASEGMQCHQKTGKNSVSPWTRWSNFQLFLCKRIISEQVKVCLEEQVDTITGLEDTTRSKFHTRTDKKANGKDLIRTLAFQTSFSRLFPPTAQTAWLLVANGPVLFQLFPTPTKWMWWRFCNEFLDQAFTIGRLITGRIVDELIREYETVELVTGVSDEPQLERLAKRLNGANLNGWPAELQEMGRVQTISRKLIGNLSLWPKVYDNAMSATFSLLPPTALSMIMRASYSQVDSYSTSNDSMVRKTTCAKRMQLMIRRTLFMSRWGAPSGWLWSQDRRGGRQSYYCGDFCSVYSYFGVPYLSRRSLQEHLAVEIVLIRITSQGWRDLTITISYFPHAADVNVWNMKSERQCRLVWGNLCTNLQQWRKMYHLRSQRSLGCCPQCCRSAWTPRSFPNHQKRMSAEENFLREIQRIFNKF